MGTTSKLLITLDEEGVVIEATEEDGKALEYEDDASDPEYEKYKGEKIEGSQLRSTSATCCWRKVNGRWKCRERFCK